MDGRRNNRGTIGNKGGGRKTKLEEQKVNNVFLNALKEIYNKDNDDDAKIAFIIGLAKTQRGQIFIAEHIFGKPTQTIDQITKIEAFNYTPEEIEKRIEELINKK